MIRGSLAAIVLLDSIDVGLETAHTDGLQDWDSVKVFIVTISLFLVIVVIVIVMSNILLQLSFVASCPCYLCAVLNKVIASLFVSHNIQLLIYNPTSQIVIFIFNSFTDTNLVSFI